MTIEHFLMSVIPSVTVGLFMAYFNHSQKERDKKLDSHAEARKRESLLALELQMATAKMAFATAIAIKRGVANGEVEQGILSYNLAKRKYLDFLNEQATNHLTE
ncbi:MAG: hypothetical protein VB120_07585 [Lachnospiraceae bacterium]|nr:hypothetical protein [Lachnospiraceae bacterium]